MGIEGVGAGGNGDGGKSRGGLRVWGGGGDNVQAKEGRERERKPACTRVLAMRSTTNHVRR